jgi:hypothetical protein
MSANGAASGTSSSRVRFGSRSTYEAEDLTKVLAKAPSDFVHDCGLPDDGDGSEFVEGLTSTRPALATLRAPKGKGRKSQKSFNSRSM